jgi:hypothetical protein
MNMKRNILFILGCALVFSSCEDLFTPAPEKFKDVRQMYTDPSYAQGFLMTTYRYLPSYYDNTEYATDDAVTNQKSNAFLKMATGSWTAFDSPLNQWNTLYGSIQYINLFLANIDSVKWAADPAANKLFNTRLKGEAFGMRALFMYYLVRNHSGYTEDGQLLGVPILTKPLDATTNDYNLPRSSFADCVKQMYQDLDSADAKLPMEYNDLASSGTVPARYQSITTSTTVYNRVMGQVARSLFNGLAAKAFRSRIALLAASPAYQDASNTTTWANAADYASAIIDYKGVNSLPANGGTYYANNSEIDGLSQGAVPSEIIWRDNLSTNNSDQEAQNFPPTLFGTGWMNPTQNLVDAFPMANGYPINNSNSNYNPSTPYSGRDPRLAKYIIYNGSTEGVSSSVILTGSVSGSDNGINVKETSTRTGYYMKKRLRMDVNRNPASITGKTHYNPRIRYTEIYLAYAEAANEAWGPTGTGTHTYSAYDIIKSIRKRAGVGGATDLYLELCKTDQNLMRDLIRNERRLELCFESFRFWDLRRWKLNLNETARGMDVNSNVYTPFDVETRSFQDYMYYGPLPYSEVLKYNNLVQNKGWR